MKRFSICLGLIAVTLGASLPAAANTQGTSTVRAIYAYAGTGRVDVQFQASVNAGCGDATQISMDTTYMSETEIDRLTRLFDAAYLAGKPVQVNVSGCTTNGSNLGKLYWANF